MFINRSTFTEATGDRHCPIVDGEIYIKGTFTREEWERLKTMFIAGFLMQRKHSHKPKPLPPNVTLGLPYNDQPKKQD